MRSRFLIALFVGTAAARALAQLGESPAITHHLDQADIDSGLLTLDQLFQDGKQLFDARFNRFDGQGRPGTTGGGAPRAATQPAFVRTSSPEADSCAGCHNQPFDGGAGDFVANVFVLAQTLDPVTESVNANFSNERNTLGMQGSGPIEMLAREMTAELAAIRAEAVATASSEHRTVSRSLVAKGVSFGKLIVHEDGLIDPSQIEGIDWDLIVKPFHQKGAVVSLREFTNNAVNHHHGMQSVERFGLDTDPDGDGVMNELTVGDITAETLFQAALNTPGRCIPDGLESDCAAGEALFDQIGCTNCHVASFTLNSRLFTEPNPYNPGADIDKPMGNLQVKDVPSAFSFDMTEEGPLPRVEKGPAGTAIIRPFTDLKRHNLNDGQLSFFANEKLPQGKLNGFAPATDFTVMPVPRPTAEFITRKLWDVGNTAPYGHRGDLTTLTDVIYYHGGEARTERDAYFALSSNQRGQIIAFLRSMQVLADGSDPVVKGDATFNPLVNTTTFSDDQITRCGSFGIVPLGASFAMLAGMRVRRRANR